MIFVRFRFGNRYLTEKSTKERKKEKQSRDQAGCRLGCNRFGCQICNCWDAIMLAAQEIGLAAERPVCRVGQNRIYTPYMTVYLVVFLPKMPYIHCIYMVLANPTCVRGSTCWLSER